MVSYSTVNSDIKCVLFDCDGVLVDSEILAMNVELREFQKLGLDVPEEYYREHLLGYSEKNAALAIRALAAEQGQDTPPPNFGALLSSKRKSKYLTDLRAVEGIRALLQSYGGEIALVSSSSFESVTLKLKIVGLEKFFGGKIFSIDHVKNGKPSPELYKLATTELGHRPDAYLALEDSINGVISAREAGVRVWGFIGGKHATQTLGQGLLREGAERLVGSAQELALILALKN